MNFYPHHIGDYSKDTSHLSMVEDGAYRRLMDICYATEKPLPLEPRAVYRLARATSTTERKAVDTVLSEFFERREDGWHQKRIDEELDRAHAKSDKARQSAGLRWQSERKANADANAMPTHEIRMANAMLTTTNNQEPITNIQKEHQHQTSGNGKNGGAGVVVVIPLLNKRTWTPPPDFLQELEAAYPAVDGPATLREIRAWCIANPDRCKPEGEVRRFINGWFERTQNA